MKIELSKYTVLTKDLVTWKDLIEVDRLLQQQAESWDLLLHFIDNNILEVIVGDSVITDKVLIEKFLFNIENSTEVEYWKIIKDTLDQIKKKILK